MIMGGIPYYLSHPDPNDPEGEHMELDNQFPGGMFRFEKIMNGGRKEMKVAVTYENGEVLV